MVLKKHMRVSKRDKLEINYKKNYPYDFTIITIVKNDERNIERTIKSVLSQKIKKVQYIVSDGNSSDNTLKIIKKYKKKIKILKYKDISFYDGLNNAIKFSKGRFIGILNSGDIYCNNFILKKVKKNNKSFDFIFENILFLNKKKKIVREWRIKPRLNKKLIFYNIAHTSLFISSFLFKKHLRKYNIKYKISSDTDLIIRMCKIPKIRSKYLNQNIVYMQIGGLSTSFKSIFLKTIEDLKILKKHFGIKFLFIYIKKILIKISGVFFIKNKNFRYE